MQQVLLQHRFEPWTDCCTARMQGCQAMQQLESILKGNDCSMSRSVPIETREQKQAWWTTRLQLDEQLTALLSDVDARYLGPWR